MTTIETLAQKTLGTIKAEPSENEPVGDVILTVTIIAVVIKLLIAAYDCWKAIPAKSLASCNKPNVFQRYRLRRIVRKVLDAEGVGSQMEPTCAALLKTGQAVKLDELMAAIIETQADKTLPATAARYGL